MGGIFNPLAPLAGFRNLLDNSNFAINQRGVSGTVTLSAGQYGHDRLKDFAGGSSYTFTTGTPDTLINIVSGSIGQAVEAQNVFGGVYTLSWLGSVKMGVAYTVGGNTTTVANGLSSGASFTIPAGAQIQVYTSGTGTLGNVQLEAGVVAAPSFERRPIGFELALCQRYYYQTTGTQFYVYQVTGYAAAAGQYMVGMLTFPTMRVTPTMGLIGAPVLTNASNFGVNPGSPSTAIIQCTSNGAGTSSAWNPQGGGFYASAEL